MGKGVWGIDVSKCSLKAVRIEGAVLTHVTVIPYERTEGEEQNLDGEIKNALLTLKATHKIGNEPVALSLPSHSTFNRLIKLPPVDDAKIPEIVRYEAQSQIPFNIDEVIWDYQYVNRTYSPGEEKEVILFAIKKDIVEQFIKNIEDLALNLECIQFGPVALFNFLLHDQESGPPSVALDMGGDNTDLVVLDGQKFWVRNLPITGNDITKALQKAFNIPFGEAEKLKLKAGQSQQAQKIFNAIQPVLRDLVNEINRSIGYYKSISKTSKFEKIILLGNSTKTLNFQKFVSQSLQLPATRVAKLNKLQVAGSVDPGELKEGLDTIGTALGLALQLSSETTNRVNLLPESERRKKELAKKKPYWIGTAVALYVLAGLFWFSSTSEAEKLKAAVGKATTLKRQVDDQHKAFQDVKLVDDLRKSLETVASISTERDLVLKIMDEINPNITENGDDKVPNDQKIWVVDWKFEEIPRQTGEAQPGGAAPLVTPGGTPLRPLPTSKLLRAALEVVITKRNNDQQGRDFIIQKLLNWSGARPFQPNKPCVIKTKNWELVEGASNGMPSWKVERDADDLTRPVSKDFVEPPGGGRDAPGEDAKIFWRYRITIEVPVGEEARKAAVAAAAAEKKPAEPPKPAEGEGEKK